MKKMVKVLASCVAVAILAAPLSVLADEPARVDKNGDGVITCDEVYGEGSVWDESKKACVGGTPVSSQTQTIYTYRSGDYVCHTTSTDSSSCNWVYAPKQGSQTPAVHTYRNGDYVCHTSDSNTMNCDWQYSPQDDGNIDYTQAELHTYRNGDYVCQTTYSNTMNCDWQYSPEQTVTPKKTPVDLNGDGVITCDEAVGPGWVWDENKKTCVAGQY